MPRGGGASSNLITQSALCLLDARCLRTMTVGTGRFYVGGRSLGRRLCVGSSALTASTRWLRRTAGRRLAWRRVSPMTTATRPPSRPGRG